MRRRRSRSSFALSLLGLLPFAACDSVDAAPTESTQGASDEPAADRDADVAPSQRGEDATLHAITVTDISGETTPLAQYAGKVVLIVNTASECGFTNQYSGLQQLHKTYADRGLVVLAFPSNDFGGQEPGSNEEIAAFVKDNFGVEFAMFSKLATKGTGQSALYKYLTTQTREDLRGEIKWNFTKFLVDGQGNVVKRFESSVAPMDAELTESVEALLADLS